MAEKSGLQTKNATPKPAVLLSQPGILQRTCECGGVPGLTGKCEECASKRLSGRRGTNPPALPNGPPDDQSTVQMQRSPLGGHSFGKLAIEPKERFGIQPKLTIGQPKDAYEQEADRVAEQVMSMAPPATPNVQRQMEADKPEAIQTEPLVETITPLVQRQEKLEEEAPIQAKCEACEQEDPIQRTAVGMPQTQPDLENRLNASQGGGSPLPDEVRSFMEPRFGADFSQVRVHTGSDAVQMNQELNAQAFTHKQDVYFGAGKAPAKDALTAHELTHVIQQGHKAWDFPIQRFHLPHGVAPNHQIDETAHIAPTFNDLLNTIKAIAKASTPGGSLPVNMDLFVQQAGGRPSTAEIDKKLGTKFTQKVSSMLNYRYLFTCRSGLIDMRHFIQLMYTSNFVASAFPGTNGNKVATRKGREHELNSESESRFGAEDTTSNAIGAFTGTQLASMPMPDDLVKEIEAILRRCDPIDFATLSPASQDKIKHHYGDLAPDPTPKNPGDLIPTHQNQTALPDILDIPECGGRERSFPFKLDPNDPDKKTISETAFDSGSTNLTSDSDIRDFVSMQRVEVIKTLPLTEKIRLVKRLFKGWTSDEDLDAIEVIYKNSTDSEKSQIRASIDPNDLALGQRIRLKLLFGLI